MSLARGNSGGRRKSTNSADEAMLNIRPITVESKARAKPALTRLCRGPGQWSFKGSKSKAESCKNYENKTTQENKQTRLKSQVDKLTFKSTWSFRRPSPPSTIFRSNSQTLKMTGRTSSSQNGLNSLSTNETKSQNSRIKLSVSTSSIPSQVCCNIIRYSKQFFNIFAGIK